ncbi:MAG: TA system VapC family ribonuclease toxin [Iamia sp.]
MILVDTNILVYAGTSGPRQEAARRWLDDRLSATTRVGLPWESLIGFVRIASNPRVFDPPAAVGDLWSQVEEWLSAGPAWTPTPGADHPRILRGLLEASPTHRLVHDAHLAALALGHGLTLCSTDAGFAAFPDLRWENPLSG